MIGQVVMVNLVPATEGTGLERSVAAKGFIVPLRQGVVKPLETPWPASRRQSFAPPWRMVPFVMCHYHTAGFILR